MKEYKDILDEVLKNIDDLILNIGARIATVRQADPNYGYYVSDVQRSLILIKRNASNELKEVQKGENDENV